MSVSDQIRALAREGVRTAEIARQLGIRYQHAYNVLRGVNYLSSPRAGQNARPAAQKAPLPVAVLMAAGFVLAGRWRLSESGAVAPTAKLPTDVGVYAFVKDGRVQYVGVATMGLARRLHFYGKPGVSQRTSLRINGVLLEELQARHVIEIYYATPPDLDWNGLPIHGSAGLELGLIKKYSLPWNIRSAKEVITLATPLAGDAHR